MQAPKPNVSFGGDPFACLRMLLSIEFLLVFLVFCQLLLRFVFYLLSQVNVVCVLLTRGRVRMSSDWLWLAALLAYIA
jgi:hypothetical protein